MGFQWFSLAFHSKLRKTVEQGGGGGVAGLADGAGGSVAVRSRQRRRCRRTDPVAAGVQRAGRATHIQSLGLRRRWLHRHDQVSENPT